MDLSLSSQVGRFQFTHPVWGATIGKALHKWGMLPFQFTHPVWGATNMCTFAMSNITFQFTHPVWGATERITLTGGYGRQVSIHAPRVGCD